MINLTYTPQRADFKAGYTVDNDILTIIVADEEEIFDFTGLPDGKAEEIVTENLPVNPIVSVEKTGDVIDIKVIRFYSEDEKHLFESGDIDG